MEIRDAAEADAAEACLVLRRSIAELCIADHQNDAAMLSAWLANKTPEEVSLWLRRPDASTLVAVEDGAVAAVGAVADSGEILLNYVSPAARFRGVSTALLAALERRAAERGAARLTLVSTETARRFYRARGYAEAGAPEECFGLAGYPMTKSLAPVLRAPAGGV